MIRVLHLIDAESDFQSQRGAQHLSRDLGGGFAAEVRTIGRGGDWRGIAAAAAGLRRLKEVEIVHAWGMPALTASALGSRARLLFSPGARLSQRGAGWLRAMLSYREIQTITPTATLRKAMVRCGVPLERCHLIRPGVDFARVKRRRNAGLRAQLGIAEDDYVLLAAGESDSGAGHRDAVWATGILHVLDPRYRLLLWGRGRDLPGVLEFDRRLANPRLICLAEARLGRRVEFEDLLPAADMVLSTATGATQTLPVAIAMAAALPIVSTVTYTLGELLEDRHTALLVAKRSPRLLAQKILQLREDGNLQWALADMAKTEAYEYFSLVRFLNQYRTVYRQMAAGEAVAVAEQAPGAGLRFHGRG